MHKIFPLAIAIALTGAMSPAFAFAEPVKGCQMDRGTTAISKGALTAQINEMGYDVRRLKAKQGCFEAYLIERESKGAVRATFSAATGELLRARLAN